MKPALVREVFYAAAVTAARTNPTSSSSSAIVTHTVAVGANGHSFTPNTIIANVEEVVVARAEYKYPCIPYEYTGLNKVGFWSDFNPVNVVLQQPPQFSIAINDTEPIFFYCSAPGSCTDQGMIGVINPNTTHTLDVQLAYAENSTFMFSPGEGYPSETTSVTEIPTSSPSPSSDSAHLSSGAIAGIVLGSITIIAFTCIFCLVYRRRRKLANQTESVAQGSLFSDPYDSVLQNPASRLESSPLNIYPGPDTPGPLRLFGKQPPVRPGRPGRPPRGLNKAFKTLRSFHVHSENREKIVVVTCISHPNLNTTASFQRKAMGHESQVPARRQATKLHHQDIRLPELDSLMAKQSAKEEVRIANAKVSGKGSQTKRHPCQARPSVSRD
ncbi:hypothetical protein V496_02121 [Pseudogymnoascus sp. VKM F-4515 (FW-2607)]|nr:hypothetical protein V496_02121 [Pseudogymnoascus sp. VKM F-4515 (FW-2607)]